MPETEECFYQCDNQPECYYSTWVHHLVSRTCPRCRKGTMQLKLIRYPQRQKELEKRGLADDPDYWDWD